MKTETTDRPQDPLDNGVSGDPRVTGPDRARYSERDGEEAHTSLSRPSGFLPDGASPELRGA